MKFLSLCWAAMQACGEFVLGLALLCLLSGIAVAVGILLCFGFIGSCLVSEAAAMWGTLTKSIRSDR